MRVVPLAAVPAQTFTVTLAGQNVRINLYQKQYGLFADVLVNDRFIVAGVLCANAARIVGTDYLGFIGDLAFYDMEGDRAPNYLGLGNRWFLAYLEASDLQ